MCWFMGLVVNSSGEQSVRHRNKPYHSQLLGGHLPFPQPTHLLIDNPNSITKLTHFPNPKQNLKGALPGWVQAPHNLRADGFALDAEEMRPFAALSRTPGTGPGLPQRSTAILRSRLTASLQAAFCLSCLAACKPLYSSSYTCPSCSAQTCLTRGKKAVCGGGPTFKLHT